MFSKAPNWLVFEHLQSDLSFFFLKYLFLLGSKVCRERDFHDWGRMSFSCLFGAILRTPKIDQIAAVGEPSSRMKNHEVFCGWGMTQMSHK